MGIKKKKVIVGMSGGVDSTASAVLLMEKGYEVIGAVLLMFDREDESVFINELKSIAEPIGIKKLIIKNIKDIFNKYVVDYFCEEYLNVRTPNPCVVCNPRIKWKFLYEIMNEENADFIATGHYARIDYDKTRKKYLLKKGKDSKKDQTYFLYRLSQKDLKVTLFPLENMTKKEVREYLSKKNIPTCSKPGSQEVCFLMGGDYKSFLRKKYKNIEKKGDIVYINNKKLGLHNGLHNYTIGQRKGLGISYRFPLYVVSMDKKNNKLIVGEEKYLYGKTFYVENVNWTIGESPKKTFKCNVSIRYRHKGEKAVVYCENNKVRVEFEKPQRAITPGQSAVFYENEIVLGGGIISETLKKGSDVL